MHLNWIKLASNPCELDSLTGRAVDRYPLEYKYVLTLHLKTQVSVIQAAFLSYRRKWINWSRDCVVQTWTIFSMHHGLCYSQIFLKGNASS